MNVAIQKTISSNSQSLERFRIFILFLLIFAFPSFLFSEPRIISLLPSQTELLCELGYQKNLVGVSDLCNFPLDVASLPKVGALELDLEKIVSLKPNYIVDLNHAHEKYKSAFEKLGMIYLDYVLLKFNEILPVAASLSADLGNPERGEIFSRKWNEKLGKVSAKRERTRRVYIEVWDSPIQAAGGGSFISDLITLSGGKNIFQEVESPYPIINAESVIKNDPEIIILTYPIKNPLSIFSRPGWESLSAAKSKSVIPTDPDIFVRPGPRCIEAIEKLSNILDSTSK